MLIRPVWPSRSSARCQTPSGGAEEEGAAALDLGEKNGLRRRAWQVEDEIGPGGHEAVAVIAGRSLSIDAAIPRNAAAATAGGQRAGLEPAGGLEGDLGEDWLVRQGGLRAGQGRESGRGKEEREDSGRTWHGRLFWR